MAAQLSFLCVAYPSLIITYLGQAAFLMVNPDSYSTTFYACIPRPVYWPMFVVAVLAAIVASQARNNSRCNMSDYHHFTGTRILPRSVARDLHGFPLHAAYLQGILCAKVFAATIRPLERRIAVSETNRKSVQTSQLLVYISFVLLTRSHGSGL